MIAPDTDQALVVKTITELFTQWKDDRSDKEETWKDCINNYLTYVDESKYTDWPWRSKVADPFSQEIGDIIAAAVKNSLFPLNEDYFDLKGRDDESVRKELVMAKYLGEKLDEARFVDNMRPFLKQLAVLGNSAAIMPWVHKTRNQKMRIRGDNGSFQTRTVERVLVDNFSFQTMDMFDAVVDPHKTYDPNSSLFIYRTDVTLASLKAAESGIYSNLGELEKTMGASQQFGGVDQSDSHKQERARVFGLDRRPEEVNNGGVQLLVALGDMVIDGQEFNDWMVVVGNDGVLLRFEENPYWGGKPVTFATYDDLWFTGYGKGPLEPVLGLQDLINTFLNQKVDVLNLAINGSFAYVDDGVIDPDDLFLSPGGGIAIGERGNLQTLSPPGNVQVAYQEIASLKQAGDRSSGLSDFERGVFPGGRKTAVESQIIKSGSSNRFNDIVKHIGGRSVTHTLNFFLRSLQQFKFSSGEIDDDVLAGDYRLRYFGADSSANRTQTLQQLETLSQVSAQNQELSLAIRETELASEWVRAIGITNPNLVRTEQEIEVERERRTALAQAEAAAAQAAVSQQRQPEQPAQEDQV